MISGIIMASGFSRRMDKNKLTLEIDGVSMIERVINLVSKSQLEEVILVYRHDEIKEIAENYNIKTIVNNTAHMGQSSSMKLGIKATNPHSQGYMFFMGDQPFLKTDFINEMILKFKEGNSPIVLPRYNGRNGSPVIFSSQLKNRLLMIEGDEGGRRIIKENPEKTSFVDTCDEIMGQDIDTWESYQQILENRRSY